MGNVNPSCQIYMKWICKLRFNIFSVFNIYIKTQILTSTLGCLKWYRNHIVIMCTQVYFKANYMIVVSLWFIQGLHLQAKNAIAHAFKACISHQFCLTTTQSCNWISSLLGFHNWLTLWTHIIAHPIATVEADTCRCI